MGVFQQKIVTTSTTPQRFFTTATVIDYGIIYPHGSNTGNVFFGATSGSEGIKLATNSDEVRLTKYADVSTLFVKSTAAGNGNKIVLLYILQD